jgi:hypothetical protein
MSEFPLAQNPDDEIRIGLLCPAEGWRAPCRVASCGVAPNGRCALNGQPWASVCVIPNSHPVTQFRMAMLARGPSLPLN